MIQLRTSEMPIWYQSFLSRAREGNRSYCTFVKTGHIMTSSPMTIAVRGQQYCSALVSMNALPKRRTEGDALELDLVECARDGISSCGPDSCPDNHEDENERCEEAVEQAETHEEPWRAHRCSRCVSGLHTSARRTRPAEQTRDCSTDFWKFAQAREALALRMAWMNRHCGGDLACLRQKSRRPPERGRGHGATCSRWSWNVGDC